MKIGCDISKIERFENIKDAFLNRYFTKSEIQYFNSKAGKQKTQTIAGIFCAKEAFLKACGVGMGNGISLQDIEITHDENGKPLINYLGDLAPFNA
ncbi:MAG: holo-ACP synthase, partial [Clostridia bacterium]